MKRQSFFIPPAAWIITSIGFSIFLGCSGISLLRARNYELQLAEYKLAVGSVLSEAQQELTNVDRQLENVPIAPEQKRELEELTRKTDAVLEQFQADIEEESEKLSIGPEEK